MGQADKGGYLRIAITCSIALLLGIAFLQATAQLPVEAFTQVEFTPVPTSTSPEETDAERAVELAVFSEIASRQEEVFLFSVTSTQLDKVEISEDDKYAFAWMGLLDTSTQEVIPTEPGLALLQHDGSEWQVVLPGDPLWEAWLIETPDDLIPPEDKTYWQTINAFYADALLAAPIPGYRLPWEAGKTVYLSGSVAHDSYIESGNAHYAFDFYIPGVMFELYASRAGTVYLLHDSQPNGDENSPGNYLVLRDATTDPVTYQLYLHLAQGSIPPELRTIGAPVARGQFIGLADDTGFSTGHHLHFQVHTNPLSYWGKSIDITFDDVAINGGRPRISKDLPYCTWPGDVCNTVQSAYISGNSKADPNPPTGGLDGFKNGDVINAPTIKIDGWATDAESGLRSVQIIAAYNNRMQDIGPVFTASPFSFIFDICQAGVPDGPVSLGLRIFDKQSNIAYLPGLVTLTKHYRCEPPPPACQAGPSQVALFAQPDYRGVCVVLNAGSYAASAFGSVGNDNAESIQVGANVMATLFVDGSYLGRAETLLANDSNLQDNLVGSNTLSSLIVTSRTQLPAIPQPVFPSSGDTYTAGNSFTLYWQNTGSAVEFQAQITGPNGVMSSNWSRNPFWTLGNELASLTPDAYTWQVRGRNPSGTSNWSQAVSFSVVSAPASTPTLGSLPFVDDVEANRGWTATGLWHREAGTSPIPAHSGNYYWWFGEAVNGDERYFTAKQGDLTSPVFNLPSGTSYFLRFWSAYQTESSAEFWDQRWLQISVNGGPFVNLLQLHGETMNSPGFAVWLPSPVVDLSSYAGSSIQIRFYFDTIDPSGNKPDNDFEGWFIDDISITTQLPPNCLLTDEPNGTPEQATETSYSPGVLLAGEICFPGDVDYFRFWGIAGDLMAANIDAQNLGSSLDSVLTLYDSDGRSVLAENDDQDYTAGNLDSLLTYRFLRTGWYYLKVRPWDYPAGGENYTYHLRLVSDETPPGIDLLTSDGATINGNPHLLQAQVFDLGSGIERVSFYWHSPDWWDPTWFYIGDGIQNGDLWQVTFDPAGKLEGYGAAFYAIAYDYAGNTRADGAWDILLDRTPPQTSVLALAPTQSTNAIFVRWEGFDALSGMAAYDLQQSIDSGAWQTVGSRFIHPVRSIWLVVAPDHLYAYRTRGLDQVGNLESYPAVEDTVTFVPSAAILCAVLDSYENDSSWQQAKTFNPGEPDRYFNFCNPAGGNFTGDQDWIRIPSPSGEQISVLAAPEAGSSGYIRLVLFRKEGDSLVQVKQEQSSGHGQPVWLTWTAPSVGDYYVQLTSLISELIGVGTSYRMRVRFGPPWVVYLPVIRR
jgi:murein DD-endopeptidase MepM/ murein hydrolase activator NlpD